MPETDLERRDAILEENMNQLAHVPARLTAIESQILQLQGEMHSEFSAVRAEMRSGFSAVRTEMRVLHEEVISIIALLQEDPEGDRPGRVKPRSRRKKP